MTRELGPVIAENMIRVAVASKYLLLEDLDEMWCFGEVKQAWRMDRCEIRTRNSDSRGSYLLRVLRQASHDTAIVSVSLVGVPR